MSRTLSIYSDGGYKKKRCAWAFYVVDSGYKTSGVERKKKKGSYEAELWAVIKAIDFAITCQVSEVNIYTDHAGIVQMHRKHLRHWKTVADVKKPIDFWTAIWEQSQKIKINMYWVPREHPCNRVVDQLCTDILGQREEIA